MEVWAHLNESLSAIYERTMRLLSRTCHPVRTALTGSSCLSQTPVGSAEAWNFGLWVKQGKISVLHEMTGQLSSNFKFSSFPLAPAMIQDCSFHSSFSQRSIGTNLRYDMKLSGPQESIPDNKRHHNMRTAPAGKSTSSILDVLLKRIAKTRCVHDFSSSSI